MAPKLDMPSEYFPWVFGILMLWVTFLTYRELFVRVTLATQKPLTLSRLEQLRAFIDEGKQLRTRSVEQGVAPPIPAAENWEKRVENHLTEHYGQHHSLDFNTTAFSGKPKVLFSGLAMTGQIRLWNSISACLDWLEDFERQLN